MDNKPDDDSVKGNGTGFVQHGWQCPVCKRVNAPWVSQCPCTPGGNIMYPTYPTYPMYPVTTIMHAVLTEPEDPDSSMLFRG